ncbi:hypothetical protein QJS66_20300 [Kocuria rhizophila]|nr:hypothetical protein QJS66_20300 [Kocuria rhizophila]
MGVAAKLVRRLGDPRLYAHERSTTSRRTPTPRPRRPRRCTRCATRAVRPGIHAGGRGRRRRARGGRRRELTAGRRVPPSGKPRVVATAGHAWGHCAAAPSGRRRRGSRGTPS